jgi:membrane-bound metal-dependent hydrolase YbcI (DUF457 family)
MDIVHHAAIGGVGMLALQATGHDVAGLAFVAGSVIADLDVVFIALGKRFYLRHHQGISHSLLLAPLYAMAVAALLSPALGWTWTALVAALAGLWLHSVLDLSNTFGMAPLAPLSKRRWSLDAVFFIDAATWVLTLAALAALYTWKEAWIGALYFAVLSAYLGLRLWQHKRVIDRLGCLFAIPSSWHVFEYYVYSENGVYRTSRYNAVTGCERDVAEIPRPDPHIQSLATRSQVYRDMQHIARALRLTEVHSDKSGTTVVARDLAVRNFGGRFARTELRFDSEGNLVHETAAI